MFLEKSYDRKKSSIVSNVYKVIAKNVPGNRATSHFILHKNRANAITRENSTRNMSKTQSIDIIKNYVQTRYNISDKLLISYSSININSRSVSY